MSKQLFMFNVKRQLATMRSIKTDFGDIDISNDLVVQSLLEKVLFRHMKKDVDQAYESGEQLDWLTKKYAQHKGLTNQKNGVSLDGEVVLDNPRPSGDGTNCAKPTDSDIKSAIKSITAEKVKKNETSKKQ